MKKTKLFKTNYLKIISLLVVQLFFTNLINAKVASTDQLARVTLELKKVTLKTVFGQIENQTDFKFFYENDVVYSSKKVSVNANNESVDKVLANVLSGTEVNFKIIDKQIVISKKQTKFQSKVNKGINKTSAAIRQIKGQVTSADGLPLPGVSIIIKGTQKGTETDFDGNFNIEVNEGDVLEFSSIGFKTLEVVIVSQMTLNVKLEDDIAALNEVVLIGYGSSKKSDLTGAVSQVKPDSYREQPITRVEEALQGRTAGVSISRANGNPGADVKIRVRGVNSITGNNDPLVVVDGVFGGDLRTINPNDIASIEVLKDASALAIYGSRGSNGVILVTTKKGKGKPKINVDLFTTVSNVPSKIDRLSSSEFARIKNEEAIVAGNPVPYTDAQISNLEANPINYEDEVLRTGFANNAQISLSGGSDKLNYFISGNYNNQKGILITNEYERFSVRSNLQSQVNDKLRVGLNLYGSRENGVNDPNNFQRFQGSVLLRALTWDPTAPIRDENGELVLRSPNNFAHNTFNPIPALNRSRRETIGDRVNANVNIKYDFTNSLSYNLIVGTTVNNSNTQAFLVDGNTEIDNSGHTRVSFDGNKNTSHQVSNILNWKKSFGSHNLDVTGVYEFQGNRSLNNGYFTIDPKGSNFFLTDDSAQENENFFNGGGQTSIQSYLGRASYNFDQSIYVTGSLRVDESSKFTKGNRTAVFPSAALAYSFNKLNFIESSNVINNLKVRIGWGQVGNENIPTDGRFAVLNNRDTPLGNLDGSSSLGGRDVQSPNPDLTWETTTQTNIGVDLGFLNNRVNFSFDYFKKNTTDLLLETELPTSSFTQFRNVGEVENKGFDISLSGDVIRNENLKWNAGIVASKVENEVVELYDGLDRIDGSVGTIDGTGRLNVIQKGESLGQFFGLTYLGVWKSTDNIPVKANGNPVAAPGDSKYLLDENGDEVLGDIGNGIPTFTWGLNNTINYKNWDFNVFIQGVHGFDVYDQVNAALHGGAGNYRDNLSRDALVGWTPDNEVDIPRNGSPNRLNSSRYVEDGSFIRLSNLSVGYTIKNPVKGLNSVKVYASGQNLFLITDYSGYDPEVSSRSTSNDDQVDLGSGINIGAIPNPRSYTFGVKLGF